MFHGVAERVQHLPAFSLAPRQTISDVPIPCYNFQGAFVCGLRVWAGTKVVRCNGMLVEEMLVGKGEKRRLV